MQGLDDLHIAQYERMTYPSYLPLLHSAGTCRKGPAIAISAKQSDCPIGLILCEVSANGWVAEIRSLFVAPGSRKLGIGRGLMIELEGVLRDRDFSEIRVVYLGANPSAPFVGRLLQQLGYEALHVRSAIVRMDLLTLMQARVTALTQLPPRFEIVPWRALSVAERTSIKERQRLRQWIPDELVPGDIETEYEVRTSVGLKDCGEIVGWLITHELTPQIVRLTCSWVQKDLQRLGRAVPMLALARSMAERAMPVGFQTATWVVNMHQTRMAKFTRRWVAPDARFYGETYGTRKLLTACAGPTRVARPPR